MTEPVGVVIRTCLRRSIASMSTRSSASWRAVSGTATRAADLTADVFLAAIESSGTYEPNRGAPAAWLFGIAQFVVA